MSERERENEKKIVFILRCESYRFEEAAMNEKKIH